MIRLKLEVYSYQGLVQPWKLGLGWTRSTDPHMVGSLVVWRDGAILPGGGDSVWYPALPFEAPIIIIIIIFIFII